MRFTDVMTIAKRMTNFGSYSGPTFSPAISARHFRVMLRKSGASRNYNLVLVKLFRSLQGKLLTRLRSKSMIVVSNM